MLETYGTGNGPDSREDLLEELRTASKRGVIIINCTQCLYGHVVDSYATGRVQICFALFTFNPHYLNTTSHFLSHNFLVAEIGKT